MYNEVMNGVAVIDVNEHETKTIFFDREVVEFAQLNSKIKKNRKRNEDKIKSRNKKIMEETERKNKEKAKERASQVKWRVYTTKTFTSILCSFILIAAVIWVAFVDLVSPFVAVPVIAYFFSKSCTKFGIWFARASARICKK